MLVETIAQLIQLPLNTVIKDKDGTVFRLNKAIDGTYTTFRFGFDKMFDIHSVALPAVTMSTPLVLEMIDE